MRTKLPPALLQLTGRYDPSAFELGRHSARVRLAGAGPEPAADVLLDGRTATLVPAESARRPDAVLRADTATWSDIAPRRAIATATKQPRRGPCEA